MKNWITGNENIYDKENWEENQREGENHLQEFS